MNIVNDLFDLLITEPVISLGLLVLCIVFIATVRR